MKARSVGLIAVAGIGVVLFGTAWLVSSLRQSDQSATPPNAVAPDSPPRSRLKEHTRQRLRQLQTGPSGEPQPTNAPAGGVLRTAGLPGAPSPLAQVRSEAAQGGSRTPPRPPVTALSWAGFPDDVPLLSKIALEDSDPERRLIAVSLLSTSDNPQIIPVLVQALSDENEEVRMAAVESLSDFTGEAPVDAIESALNDPSADIRFEALSVLADIGGERAHHAIQRALHDPDPDVRALAEDLAALERVPQNP